MHELVRLRGPVQHYAWGSHTLLPDFLGMDSPDPAPWAELWLGTHPLGPAEARVGGEWIPLSSAIARDPVAWLGAPSGKDGNLPFLMKVLAVDQPLSLQVHPSTAQALSGLRREAQLPAPQRHYRDASGKPEILCALTTFTSLCGWRSLGAVAADLRCIGAECFGAPELEAGSFPAAVTRWLAWRDRKAGAALMRAVAAAARSPSRGERFRWVTRLAEYYPGDLGVLAPLWLNLVELAPGEALYLAAGEPHSHLGGMAIELTPSSDNVIRGALTQKRVDVDEFCRIANHESRSPVRPGLEEDGFGWQIFDATVSGFCLGLAEAKGKRRADGAGPAILLCREGCVRIETTDGSWLDLERGQSCFVPAVARTYRVGGTGVVFRAAGDRNPPPTAGR